MKTLAEDEMSFTSLFHSHLLLLLFLAAVVASLMYSPLFKAPRKKDILPELTIAVNSLRCPRNLNVKNTPGARLINWKTNSVFTGGHDTLPLPPPTQNGNMKVRK